MKIEIVKVYDFGYHSTERVELKVNENCKLEFYMVADTTYKDDNISDKLRHVYWFPIRKAEVGDRITIYTKPGDNYSESINNGKNKHHYFYWGLKSYVWNNKCDTALLIHLEGWESTHVNV